jgi:hypothetical protein
MEEGVSGAEDAGVAFFPFLMFDDSMSQSMRDPVAAVEKRRFVAEARSQSRLISDSADEVEVMRWIEDVTPQVEGRGPANASILARVTRSFDHISLK